MTDPHLSIDVIHERLSGQAATCAQCGLAESRTQVVWAAGKPSARIMLVGEAPGRNEDEGGEPFIGAAGKVLDGVLAEVSLARDDLYITNVVKCRPPQNRTPNATEIQACSPWLKAQIELIKPRVIGALGLVATRSFNPEVRSMGAVQGVPFAIEGYTVVPMYHPAAIIYDRQKYDALLQSARILKSISVDA